MAIKVTDLNSKEPLYPLTRGQLQSGQFAECENGNVVFMGRGRGSDRNPTNINNGCAGFGIETKFRLLRNHELVIKLNSDGSAGGSMDHNGID